MSQDIKLEYFELIERRIDTLYTNQDGVASAKELEIKIIEAIGQVADLPQDDLKMVLEKILNTVFMHVHQLNKSTYLLAISDSLKLYKEFFCMEHDF